MKKNIVAISTLNMTREEWLDARRQTIGGSDAAAIVGLSKWATPLTVYMDKKGLAPDKPDSIPMRIGRELEETVARLWMEETGKKCQRRNAILINPAYPFAHANVDRWVVGENAGLECKTTSEMNMKTFRGNEYPANYYVQCMHYMMVTGANRWYLAVLVGNRELFTFTIERDEEEIEALKKAEEDFYNNHLLPGIMPAPSGADKDTDALNELYPEGNDDEDANLDDMTDVFNAYIQAESSVKLAERHLEQAKQDIKARLGNAERGHCGGHKVTWKTQTTKRVDTKALEQMDIDIPYKTTTSRTFRFTAAK